MNEHLTEEFDAFIYTHIPKCGGTSFRKLIYDSALKSGIPESGLYVPGFGGISNEKNLPQLTAPELDQVRERKLKVIATHAVHNFVRHIRLPIYKPFYYTILREPITRFISHYNFFYFKLGQDNCTNIHLNELGTDRLVGVLRKLANLQTLYIVGFDFDGTRTAWKPEEQLEVAKFNLKYEYQFFGILENIDNSFQHLTALLPDWLAVEGTFPVKNKNVIEREEEIREDVMELIIEYNKYDVQLYDYAVNYFNEKYQNKNNG